MSIVSDHAIWLAVAAAIIGVLAIISAHQMDKTSSIDNDSFTTEVFLAGCGLVLLTVALLLLVILAFLT